MLGAIIPQPLAIPPKVKVEPRTTASFCLWSVVRMPRAASSPPPLDSFFASFGVAPRILSIGSGVPMIPVEQTSTSAAATPNASAAASPIASASARPAAPVPALALPELTITAAALPPFAARSRRSRITGGAANLFCVKTAAAVTACRSSVATSAMS